MSDERFEDRLFTGRDVLMLMDEEGIGYGATLHIVERVEVRHQGAPNTYRGLEGPKRTEEIRAEEKLRIEQRLLARAAATVDPDLKRERERTVEFLRLWPLGGISEHDERRQLIEWMRKEARVLDAVPMGYRERAHRRQVLSEAADIIEREYIGK